jgi:flagellum-specific peptidoglycan hydrolase FlgJ
MKLNYSLLFVLTISLFVSCKSKKNTVQKKTVPQKHTVQTKPKVNPVKENEEIITVIVNSTDDYIKKFKKVAMEEMRIYKIPASITLAQGILESSSGKSQLTLKSNNHFGIKCHKGWKGKKTYWDDDEKGECFRVYKDPRTSFKDHSEFLSGRSRYASLFTLNEADYVGWAKGLSKAGYATDRRYPAKLIALIEKYNLHKYDMEVLGKHYKKPKKLNTVNAVVVKGKTHVVAKGETLYSISKKYGLSVAELKKINGLNSNNINIGQTLILTK